MVSIKAFLPRRASFTSRVLSSESFMMQVIRAVNNLWIENLVP